MLFGSDKHKNADTTPHLDNGPTFKKRLGWWIKSGREETITLDVTPEMAAEMLEYNDRNRPLSTGVVKKYAAMMRAGDWHYTRAPVIFSDKRLIDGQHRLAGIVESGETVRLDLAFGSPDDAFPFHDVGKTRTGADIFSINGVANAPLMSAATQIIHHYEAGTSGCGFSLGGGQRLNHKALYEEFAKRPDMPRSTHIGHLFHTNPGLAPPATMLALHYICARHHRAQADEFFSKLATGENINRKDAVFMLRKRLLEQGSAERLSRGALASLTLKAWNAMRLGRPVGQLRYNPDEVFPRAH